MRFKSILVLSLFFIVTLAGHSFANSCGSKDQHSHGEADHMTVSTAKMAKIGEMAPNFTLTSAEGKKTFPLGFHGKVRGPGMGKLRLSLCS